MGILKVLPSVLYSSLEKFKFVADPTGSPSFCMPTAAKATEKHNKKVTTNNETNLLFMFPPV
jgi:hypothetical protein